MSLRVVVEQSGVVSEDGGLGAVGDVELGEQPRYVGLDGGLADEQRPCCVCVRLSAADEDEDLELTVRQDAEPLAGSFAQWSGMARDVLGDQLTSDGGREHLGAGGDGA